MAPHCLSRLSDKKVASTLSVLQMRHWDVLNVAESHPENKLCMTSQIIQPWPIFWRDNNLKFQHIFGYICVSLVRFSKENNQLHAGTQIFSTQSASNYNGRAHRQEYSPVFYTYFLLPNSSDTHFVVSVEVLAERA